MSNVTELPKGNIALNLDDETRENAPEPFISILGGREILWKDPEEIDWQDLLEIEDPYGFLRHCVSEDDRKFILSHKMPGWKFGILMDSYQTHYGIKDRIREAQRRARG